MAKRDGCKRGAREGGAREARGREGGAREEGAREGGAREVEERCKGSASEVQGKGKERCKRSARKKGRWGATRVHFYQARGWISSIHLTK